MDEVVILIRLSKIGYMHMDVVVRCPQCNFIIWRGLEPDDEPSEPIYWNPRKINKKKKKRIIEALKRQRDIFKCPICDSEMEIHKVLWSTQKFKKREIMSMDKQIYERLFIVSTKPRIKSAGIKVIESGILVQVKCMNKKCKYVRYFTL